MKAPELTGKVAYTGARLVTTNECFVFCKTQEGTKYFGTTDGKSCWCAKLYDGPKMSQLQCNKPCAGDTTKMCGGIQTASVYVMFDCTPPTTAEKAAAAAEAKKKTLSSYATFKDQTCAQNDKNKLKVDGAFTKVGSVDDCKIACMKGGNSMQCHGFTYEKAGTKCTFHYDVLDGKVTKGTGKECYFKKLG